MVTEEDDGGMGNFSGTAKKKATDRDHLEALRIEYQKKCEELEIKTKETANMSQVYKEEFAKLRTEGKNNIALVEKLKAELAEKTKKLREYENADLDAESVRGDDE